MDWASLWTFGHVTAMFVAVSIFVAALAASSTDDGPWPQLRAVIDAPADGW